ncbi:MAG: AEC family transporter [Treponema sp.]|jgi:predicted permease|nr:AEC family transporter [Treponema sp.]
MGFFTSLQSVALLLSMVAPGYILRKTNMLDSGAVQPLVTLLLYVSLPFMTFSSILKKEYESGFLGTMGIALLLSFILLVGMYFFSRLLFSFMKDTPDRCIDKRILVASTYMSNCGFMGVPLLRAFFPGDSEPIIYAAIFTAVYNFLSWTLGIYAISGKKQYVSLWHGIVNPPTLTLFIALPLFFLSLRPPPEVMTIVDFLGEMTSPLSMIIIGLRLAEIRFRELFNSPPVYAASAARLLLAPLCTFGFLFIWRLFLPLNAALFLTLLVIMAMPVGTNVILMAEMFGGDKMSAVKCILLSSLLSVVTVPLVMLLGRWI